MSNGVKRLFWFNLFQKVVSKRLFLKVYIYIIMSNFFEKAKADAKALEESLLGPNYKYYEYINTPADMGMSSNGSISTITKDIAGIIGYVTLLSSGGGRASKVAGPLGNKFFLETGAKCTDKATGELVTRSIMLIINLTVVFPLYLQV